MSSNISFAKQLMCSVGMALLWSDVYCAVYVFRQTLATTTTNTMLFSCWSQTQKENTVSGITGVVSGSRVKVHYCRAIQILTELNNSFVRSMLLYTICLGVADTERLSVSIPQLLDLPMQLSGQINALVRHVQWSRVQGLAWAFPPSTKELFRIIFAHMMKREKGRKKRVRPCPP